MLRFAFIPRIRALAAMDKGLSTLGPTRGYKTHKKIFLVFIKITSWWRELSLMWAPPVDIGTIKSHRPLRGGGGDDPGDFHRPISPGLSPRHAGNSGSDD